MDTNLPSAVPTGIGDRAIGNKLPVVMDNPSMDGTGDTNTSQMPNTSFQANPIAAAPTLPPPSAIGTPNPMVAAPTMGGGPQLGTAGGNPQVFPTQNAVPPPLPSNGIGGSGAFMPGQSQVNSGSYNPWNLNFEQVEGNPFTGLFGR